MCSLNSYSPAAGLSACDSCSLNQYLHLDPADASFAQCLPCIDSAICWPNGSITSDAGAFILIDASRAVITAASCHSSACLDAAVLMSGSELSAPRIPLSGLPVLNRCGPGRLPAEINLLCAACLPGYTEWNGKCLQCSGVDVLGLSALCLLSLLLLYGLHRLPSSVESSWLSMLIFYLQLALLFATHDTVPQWLSVLNVDLLGDFHTPSKDATLDSDDSGAAWCIAQLSAWDKIGLHVVMPIVALTGLVLVFLFERCMQTVLFRRNAGPAPARSLSLSLSLNLSRASATAVSCTTLCSARSTRTWSATGSAAAAERRTARNPTSPRRQMTGPEPALSVQTAALEAHCSCSCLPAPASSQPLCPVRCC